MLYSPNGKASVKVEVYYKKGSPGGKMILIVNMNYKRLGYYEFVLLLCSIVESREPCEVKYYSRVKDTHKYRKIILSGTPLMDNEYLTRIDKFFWIRECDTPILGICAGMQIVGLVFDSDLIPCKEIGMAEIVTVRENPLFSSRFEAYALHNYGILPGKDFEILARSDKCVQGIKHKEKEIYGVLFHPEVRNKEVIKKFILL